MKKLIILLGISLMIFTGYAQKSSEDFKPSGKATGKVFWNYHYDMTSGETQESSFEIKRAYFGYKYNLSKAFTASLTFDVGKNEGGSDYTAYLKKAQLEWKLSDQVKLAMGMIGLVQFNDQEKFWGYRYLMKSFQDQYGFGSSADLGLKANFKLSKQLSANVFIVNGEGYKKVQDDFGQQKVGGNLVLKLDNGLSAKVYFDSNSFKFDKSGDGTEIADTTSISTIATFIGYKADKFRIGAEFSQMFNGKKYSKPAENQDLYGYSAYATYIINKKVEVFGRFDHLESNRLSGADTAWNYSKDGDALVAGIQYAPVKGIKMSLNYQGWKFEDSDKNTEAILLLNFEYKF